MEITNELIQGIVDAEYEIQTYNEDEAIRPVPGAPASPAELSALDAHLRTVDLPFPPSYRTFLSICNGIKGFKSYFSLLDVQGVLRPAPETCARRYPGLARFIIGRGESLEFLAFDGDKAVAEELEVVFVADDGEESRYPRFADYMNSRFNQLKRALELERADRKKLKKKRG